MLDKITTWVSTHIVWFVGFLGLLGLLGGLRDLAVWAEAKKKWSAIGFTWIVSSLLILFSGIALIWAVFNNRQEEI